MNQEERSLINDLFGRLHQAETQSGPRDVDAENAIRDAVARQPAAPYYMAQAILVQEQLLQNLQDRVQQLENELSRRPAAGGNGFLSGLFGAQTARNGQGVPPPAPTAYGAIQPRSGGFMGGGALQTVMAVAGGVVLGSMVADMLAGDEALAAEEIAEEPEAMMEDSGHEDFFGGGDEEEF